MNKIFVAATGWSFSAQCFAAGKMSSDDEFLLWYILPLAGYVIAFVVMVCTERAARACAVSSGLLLLFAISPSVVGRFALLLLVFGPWILFLALLLSCFIPKISTAQNPDERHRPIPTDSFPWSKLP